MAYWVKLTYERDEYVVDLDCISAFACAPNGKITFWLPDSETSIIMTQQGNPDDYQTLLNYVKALSENSLTGSWVTLVYDRCEYVIDLNRISAFRFSNRKKVTFWLPDSCIPIIITQKGDPEGFNKVITFIEKKTGKLLS